VGGGRRLGVVFVHGIRSGPEVWGPLRELIAADPDLGFVETLAFQYATGLRRIHPLRVYPSIDTAADSLKEFLRTEAGEFERLMLVTHSQGGLVAQRCLARMLGEGHGRELVRIGRVVMLACPNNGSELMLSLRRRVLGGRHPQEAQLRPLNEQVTATLRTITHDIVHASAVTDRTCPIPFSVYAGESDGVVTPASAQSVFRDAAALPGDHSTILKATTPQHRTFTTLRRLIRDTATAGDADDGPAPGNLPAPPDPAGSTSPGGILFHAVVPGGGFSVRLPPRITPGPSDLPTPSATFTGREEHVEALLQGLSPGTRGRQVVLVSAVSGLAGVGKTELVVQTAARARAKPGWFPGGVLFTDLAGYDPERRVAPEQALEGLLRVLGIPGEHIPSGLPERQRLYHGVLARYAEAGRRILVVVDNASTTDQARPLLPTDGTTAALVTSRHTLDGLDARLHDLDTLDEPASVALLDQALRRARGDEDTRLTDDRDAAGEIARLCAGLPLALRIAAAHLAASPTRPVASLAAALRTEHTRLDRLHRSDRAVRAAFDLSYHLLDDDHARLFRLLPLNPGPDLSTEAAAHLADMDVDRAEELLQHLADAHLIEHGSTWGRWQMHDLVRLYADERGRAPAHAETDQRRLALTRLFTHYAEAVDAAETHMDRRSGLPPSPRFRDRNHALEWLDAEYTNLTRAAHTAPKLGHPTVTVLLAFLLAHYLSFRRYFEDWIAITTAALEHIREIGDRGSESSALNNLGIALTEVRRYQEAIDAHTQNLATCRGIGDRPGEGTALSNLGIALTQADRYEEAIDAYTRAVGIHRETGNRPGEGTALSNLGIALTQVHRYEEAIDAYTRAVEICRETGDRQTEGYALNNLGVALRRTRQDQGAIDAYRQDLIICRETGDRHGEGKTLGNLGLALAAAGRHEEGISAVKEAIEIYRGLAADNQPGYESDLANSLLYFALLGSAAEEEGALPSALSAAEEAVQLYSRLATAQPAVFTSRLRETLQQLAEILKLLGRTEEAEQAHRRLSELPPEDA
jgi:tetratricopeptide (TPR) repeat protein